MIFFEGLYINRSYSCDLPLFQRDAVGRPLLKSIQATTGAPKGSSGKSRLQVLSGAKWNGVGLCSSSASAGLGLGLAYPASPVLGGFSKRKT